MAGSLAAGAPGGGEEGAGEPEGNVPAGPGAAQRVHQVCGEGEGAPGAPEEDQEEDHRGRKHRTLTVFLSVEK